MQQRCIQLVVTASIVLWAVSARSTPQDTLERCQQTVRKAAHRFIVARTKAVQQCLAAVARQVIGHQAEVAPAAMACGKALGRLVNNTDPTQAPEAELRALVAARCDPAAPEVEHTLQDILGAGPRTTQPIGAAHLDAWCERFGGDGSIDTLPEWVDCIVAGAECGANHAIVTQYPRALEWLDEIRPALLALTPPATAAVAALDAVNAALEGRLDDDVPDLVCGTTCGDGLKNGDDGCDGTDLGGATCISLGFGGGTLRCTPSCSIDATGCATHGGQTLPPTGQTTCWDTGAHMIQCVGTGQDGEHGGRLAFVDNGDGTITDLHTNLMWETKSDDGSLHDKDKLYSWDTAFTVHVAELNRSNFAGYGDWRVPNVKELLSIVDYESYLPAVHPVFNARCAPSCRVTSCSCNVSNYAMSSTTVAGNTGGVWIVHFGYGLLIGGNKSATDYRIRAVRSCRREG